MRLRVRDLWAEHGLSSVELMLLLPLFCLLLFGGLELARAAALKMALDNGVWQAARYLAVYDPWDEAQAVELVALAAKRSVLGGAEAKVHISDDGARHFGNALTVYAETELAPLIPFLTPKPLVLRATHTQRVEVYP